MSDLNYKDIAIIDALPVYDHKKTILNVGCGNARIDRYIIGLGYRVFATDMVRDNTWKDNKSLTFHDNVNVFNISTFPIQNSPIVICSEVLEHLSDFKSAFVNLMSLTKTRLIITVPFQKSFNVIDGVSPHCNFWSDGKSSQYRDINEFKNMVGCHSISISKIITKQRDYQTGSRAYLIVIDKRWPKNGAKS